MICWIAHRFSVALLACALITGGSAAAQKGEEAASPAASLQLIAQADSLHALALQLRNGDHASERRAIVLLLAEIAIQQRLDRHKEVGAAWNIAGHAFSELQQYDSAEVAYRRAIVARLEAGDRHGVAASTNNIGNVFLNTNRPDSAVAYYERAAQLAREEGERQLEASLLTNLAVAYNEQVARDPRRLDSAIEALHSALAIHTQLATEAEQDDLVRTLRDLGHRHDDAKRADSALFYWRAALQVASRERDPAATNELLYGIGAFYDRADMLDSARVYFTLASEAAERGADPVARADAEYRIGDLHTQRGQSDSALTYYRSALRLVRGAGDSIRVGNFLYAIGHNARLAGQLDTASYYLHAALSVFRAEGSRRDEARVLAGLARYFSQSGRRDSAVVKLGEALDIHRELGDASARVHTLIALGNTLSPIVPGESRAIRDSSRQAFGEALNLATANGDGPLRATVHSALANHYQYWGQNDSTRRHAATALDIYRREGNVAGQIQALRSLALAYSSADSTAAYVDETLALARRGAGQSMELGIHLDVGRHYLLRSDRDSVHRDYYRTRSRSHLANAVVLARAMNDREAEASALEEIGILHATADPPRWTDAAAYFDSAWVVLEGLRRMSGDDAARIAVAGGIRHMNSARLLMWAWGERAKETGEQQDRRRALAARERGRSRALLDLIGGEADAMLDGPLDAIAESLIQAVARPGIATVLYTVGQTTSIEVILPSGRIEGYEIVTPDDTVSAQVDRLRSTLGVEAGAARAAPEALESVPGGSTRDLFGGTPSDSATAAQLGVILESVAEYALPQPLRDLLDREGIHELVIITDGPVALIPFAALPYDTAALPLGQRMRLRFAPSLALVANGARKDGPARLPASSLVVGNPLMPTVTGAKGPVQLNQLPGSEEEADSIAAALGTVALIGGQASEKAVRAALATASVIHLATHGYAYASEHRVRDSFIALAPGEGEDGLLTMGEVIDEIETIAADLVVLSACQTALGSISRAEGTVGLQRAFLAKGARSLLVSLWSVDDAVTKNLMVRFYHHWLGGKTKAEALLEAQADVRRTHPNPRYWAAFQLVGDG